MATLTPTNVLSTAYNWDSYYEKASSGTDAQLQNKTWNAGYNNITWFWRYLDRLGYGNYQGQAWCDGWVDFVFIETAGGGSAGYKRAKAALGGFSAYTPTSANMFKNISSSNYISASGTPRPGDVIFFKDSTGLICHTGIVCKVTSSTVYTIEGNTSSASGVIANGGCVRQKSYSRSYSRIACYGRPKWEDVDSGELVGESYAEQVYNWFLDHGYSPQAACGILGNMQQESGVDPTCLQKPTPYAAGIVQWERYNTCSGRFAIMKSYAEKKGKTWQDLRSQLEFLDLELSGGDVEYGGDGYTATLVKKYAGSLASFKATTDIENAVKIFHDAFERSSQPMWEVRYSAANNYYNSFAGSSASSGTTILRLGNSGEAVRKMQQLLINKGYDLGSYGADGEFGQATYEALKQFQADNNLSVDGEYGPASKAALEGTSSSSSSSSSSTTILRLGSSGAEVKKMQKLLLNRGYDLGSYGADGEFGQATYEALKQFQAYHNLEVDGEYGPASRAVLEQPFNRGYLQKGDSSDEVRDMQLLLMKAGYSVGASGADGEFGQNTYNALVKFQKENGLTASGHYDTTTKEKLNAVVDAIESKDSESSSSSSSNGKGEASGTTYRYGMEGDEIKEIQKLLKTKWKYDLTPSGKFSQATLEIVVNFQTYHGLDATGKLDPATIDKIKNETYHPYKDNWISKYQLGVNIANNAKLDVTGEWNESTGKSVKVLTTGSSGSMVRLMQEILVTKYNQELVISGSYDADTKKAVQFIQYYYGLEETGKVGRSEWNVVLTCDYPVKTS